MNNKFLFYNLLNKETISIVNSSTYGAKMPRANWDFIKNLPIPTPPLTEQQTIADFLDKETAKIDTLVGRIENSLTLLREYRTALITAAVTGTIDVRHP